MLVKKRVLDHLGSRAGGSRPLGFANRPRRPIPRQTTCLSCGNGGAPRGPKGRCLRIRVYIYMYLYIYTHIYIFMFIFYIYVYIWSGGERRDGIQCGSEWDMIDGESWSMARNVVSEYGRPRFGFGNVWLPVMRNFRIWVRANIWLLSVKLWAITIFGVMSGTPKSFNQGTAFWLDCGVQIGGPQNFVDPTDPKVPEVPGHPWIFWS